MRPQALMSVRNPVWKVTGHLLVYGVIGGTALFAWLSGGHRKPSTSPVGTANRAGMRMGHHGTLTERLDKGTLILNYETVIGDEEHLHLEQVDATLREALETWRVTAPQADREAKIWTLGGPVDIRAMRPDSREPVGQGRITGSGPALRWDVEGWHGLGPLEWEGLEATGRGHWLLPAGWLRTPQGEMIVERGPVRWEAREPGALRAMDVQSLRLADNLSRGTLNQVTASLEGGTLTAERSEIDPAWIHWIAPLHFQRDDGWQGDAQGGLAPRPQEHQAPESVELKAFQARRQVAEGEERVRSEGARWTSQGLRLEGKVHLEQPFSGGTVTLDAPRMLMRQLPGGTDLPPALPPGHIWAEGTPVLSWGKRTLSSPRIEVRYQSRAWIMQAPVRGRSEFGTFTAGQGGGTPEKWAFEGPIRGDLTDGGILRGSRLTWEQEKWTLEGHPASLQRLQQRISGARLTRVGGTTTFPDGLSGTLAGEDGDYVIRADQGTVTPDSVVLTGRVDCRSRAWKLAAERVVVRLGPGNSVQKINAAGSVTLRGSLGEGWGEAIDIDVAGKTAHWQGRVKGSAEVQQ
nr:LptA/OstA family protein [uncultured Holophaga sp.]